jgi:DNA-binding FadR family transcriptional regulator
MNYTEGKAGAGIYANNAGDKPNVLERRSHLASDPVVQEIRDALFAGKLTAGDYLGTESDLVEHFGISRAPMRDALKSLAAMGIIEIRVGGNGGIYIAQGNPVKFAEALSIQHKLLGISCGEMFDLQIAIEDMAIQLAVKNASDDSLELIADLVDGLAEYADDRHEFSRRSPDFHIELAKVSGNRAIYSQMSVFIEMIFKYFIPTATLTEAANHFDFIQETLQHDAAMFKALQSREADKARELNRSYWSRLRTVYR